MSEVEPDVWAAAARRLVPVAPPPPGALTSIPARRGERVVVVAGPGVLAAGAGGQLRTLTGITGATVVNTVGAKGLFAWDDPLHGGTVGLQAEDPALAEITTADLVISTGLDPAESVGLTVALQARSDADPASVVDVHPAHLGLAAGGWPPADRPGDRPPIYGQIASLVGPMYDAGWVRRSEAPRRHQWPPGASEAAGDAGVAPPRAARALAEALPEGGLVVAPPGPTGFWIGRTFPTSVAGSVIVTTGDPEGTAEVVALEAARAGRSTTLVVAAHEQPLVVAIAGGSLVASVVTEQLPLDIEVWTEGSVDAEPDPAVRQVMVDWSALDSLVAVAGEPDPAIWPGRAP